MKSFLLLIFLLVSLIGSSYAEDKVDEKVDESKAKEPEDPQPKLTFDDRFWLESEDYKLSLGGLLQIDSLFFTHSKYGNNQFIVRRARLIAAGQLYSLFGFVLNVRWDRCQAELHHAYIETLKPECLRLRVGLFKEPFSLEALYTDAYLDFDERSLGIINYVHTDDMGAMVFGKYLCGQFEYWAGVFNGRGRNTENNSAKEFVGRLVYAPFLFWCEAPIEHLYVGVSMATSKQDEDLSGDTFRTGAFTNFWTWAGTSDAPVEVHATKKRWGADLEWLWGPTAIRAECVFVDWGKVSSPTVSRNFSGYGWYVQATHFLTSEYARRNAAVVPCHNFDLCGGGGAWALALRYEVFQASKRVLDAGLATGAARAEGPTVAVNWYLNPYVCVKTDWQYLRFSNKFIAKNVPIQQEQVVTIRVQTEF